MIAKPMFVTSRDASSIAAPGLAPMSLSRSGTESQITRNATVPMIATLSRSRNR